MQAVSTERSWTYQGRSWSSFVLLEAKKSAEIIVGKVKACYQYFMNWWRAKTEATYPKDWTLTAKENDEPIDDEFAELETNGKVKGNAIMGSSKTII